MYLTLALFASFFLKTLSLPSCQLVTQIPRALEWTRNVFSAYLGRIHINTQRRWGWAGNHLAAGLTSRERMTAAFQTHRSHKMLRLICHQKRILMLGQGEVKFPEVHPLWVSLLFFSNGSFLPPAPELRCYPRDHLLSLPGLEWIWNNPCIRRLRLEGERKRSYLTLIYDICTTSECLYIHYLI